MLLLLLFLTFSALVANPKKTTLHGGQSRSWSAEQGKKGKEKSGSAPPPPPPPRALLVRRYVQRFVRVSDYYLRLVFFWTTVLAYLLTPHIG